MKRPPIDGMPSDRPTCPGCGVKLRPWCTETEEYRETEYGRRRVVTSRTFARWNAYDGIFCTLRCARAFAFAAYRAGYRLKGVKHV